MGKSRCSLWILVAVTDIEFMMRTIPHLVKMCRYPFTEKVLLIDNTPIFGEKEQRSHIGSIEVLRSRAKKLVGSGVMDRIEEFVPGNDLRVKIYGKYFGKTHIKATHNYKCAPYLGYFYLIERSVTDLVLHFNSDMLLYQKKGADWISRGIEILSEKTDVLCARPFLGPAGPDPDLSGMKVQEGYALDSGLSSRCFLISRKKFENISKLNLLWAEKQGRIKDRLPAWLRGGLFSVTGKGLLESWEKTVSAAMRDKGLKRAHIIDPFSFTLHPRCHGNLFLELLPAIIERLENGEYPGEQCGNYDLDLEAWKTFLGEK